MTIWFHAFITLLVVIDPVGVAAAYAAMTHGMPSPQRRHVALRGVLLAGAVLCFFALTGNAFMQALGIGLPAFRIAGGILLFILAMDMIIVRESGLRTATGQEQREAETRHDISVFPLAIPLIAGPGAITSTVLLMGRAWPEPWDVLAVLAMLAVTLGITLASLLLAGAFTRILGVTGTNVVGRTLGIVLGALAVQFVLDGLQQSGILHR